MGNHMAGYASRIGSGRGLLLLLPAALALFSASAEAQDTPIGLRPFIGCWKPLEDPAARALEEGEATPSSFLCFQERMDGVQMLTVTDGQVTHTEPFLVDGLPKEIEQDGCSGTESARFSSDQRRIYTETRLECREGPARGGTGIIAMISRNQWIDVRSVMANGRPAAWARSYLRASEPARALGIPARPDRLSETVAGVAGIFESGAPTVDDVIEASGEIDPVALEAWLAETGLPLERINADALVRMADAGVDAGVIDMVVAISFPERFALRRAEDFADEPSERAARRFAIDRYGPWGSYGGLYRRGLYYGGYGYPYYGYGYGYGYSGGWYGGGVYRPVIVTVDPREQASGGGRAVAGKGYTRGGRPASGSGARGWDRGSSSSGSVGRSTSGSSGRSSSTGRKAKRRGGSF